MRWTSKSCRRLSNALKEQGFSVSRTLVGKLLAQLGYTLQGNAKTREGTDAPDRDGQFEYINDQVADFLAGRQPVISVDTKKKELVGDFRNGSREWRPKGRPEEVNVHDFPDKKLGKAAPYAAGDLSGYQEEGTGGRLQERVCFCHGGSAFSNDNELRAVVRAVSGSL